ncbi:phospholipid carrier-dependent glycosyltransferase [Cohnella lubricantis]|uniref:Polyprenol-phosphate-mannose--protein mannosyltransferase n=1 Tax=Cohnella lubricantis TaxID=2163172 RepID=A0A841TI04_9BACL|nr:phospholipid carrier-dependent glycosyltransferase [Cohnella lubricantis]MBB6679775.1 phospholipid carrier-dependent glycosyltransferase [Cohnella lubricantis]MBP2119948.1 dolichyl-phosphate-mannose--protein O-mannosyl transferase [Cohnella lubricantis]
MDWTADSRSSPIGFGTGGSGARSSRRWTRLDWMIIAILTFVSALMSFHDLGNRSAPQTYWKPSQSGEGFIVDFGRPQTVDRLNLYEGPGATGKSKIEYSVDGTTWQLYTEVEHKVNRVFTWKTETHKKDEKDEKSEPVSVEARYIRYTVVTPGFRIYEAGLFANGSDAPIPIAGIEPIGTRGSRTEGAEEQVFDEQSLAPFRQDYRNSMFFDEIYHGRTAYEFVHSWEPYENTHPPLGKDILSIGVQLFGMTPYGWRFMAAVGGTAMIPVFYMALRGMFKRTRYAAVGTLLMLFEGFHLVHSRMANVDIFGVTFTILMIYFMYRYGEMKWRDGGFAKGIGCLALSGFFFGCAASVKWNYLYGGAGLAILFFLFLYRHIRDWRRSGQRSGSAKRAVLTLLACLVLFLAIPAATYATTYIPYLKGTVADDGFKDLWQYQKNMYHYHKGVKEAHPYASKWYTWPFMVRPVWYYGGVDLGKGDAQSIAAIGNPLVWWGGLLAMLFTWALGLLRRDRIALTIAVMYLSFYVPWMVAPRSITFLYHYFPMVPLLILSIVWLLKFIEERTGYGKRLTWLTVAGAGVLLVWFYPVLTGMTISREWMNFGIRWLDSWGF